jgi:cytochrome P450
MATATSAVSKRALRAPGPRAWPLLGHLPAMQRDPIGFLFNAARYGDVVRLRLVERAHLVNHPDYAKHVLQDRAQAYRKTFRIHRLRPLLGLGLVTTEGEAWRRQRRLAQAAFHAQHLSAFAAMMGQQSLAMLERWEDVAKRGEPIDLHSEMMALSFCVVGQALLGVDLHGEAREVGSALSTALEIFDRRLARLWPLPLCTPTRENRRASAALRRLDQVVGRIIQERRSAEPRADLLGLFMAAVDADTGDRMTDAEVRDEVKTMVVAGQETSANALAWTLFLMSRHPEVAARLRACSAPFRDRLPALEDLPQLEYAQQVLQESMRLYPPAWLLSRRAAEDDRIGEYSIPRGSNVFISPYLLHRDPRFWSNPENFDPERFAGSCNTPRAAYLPFALGPRICIGARFAMMEMQIALSLIAARFRIELVPSPPVELDPNVMLRPKHGIWARLLPWSAQEPVRRQAHAGGSARG